MTQRRTLAAAIRRDHPAAHRLDLRFGDCAVAVHADREETIGALADYYGPFVTAADPAPPITVTVHQADPPDLPVSFTRKPPDPGKTRIKEEFVDLPDGRIVRKRLTGMIFLFGEGDHLAVGPCRENLNQVINFINNRYIEWKLCDGCLLGHAAGVLLDGRGLALAGTSGAGKSTLALELMNHGARFVSNDRIMVTETDQGLSMFGVAKLPRINPGTALNNPNLEKIVPDADRERFSGLSRDRLWAVEHKYDAPIDRCFGPDRFVLSGPMDGLVILNWDRDAGEDPRIRRVEIGRRPDLLAAFMKPTGLFFLPDDPAAAPDLSEAAYIRLLSRHPVWEIVGGVDFARAALDCMACLSESAGA